MKQRAGDAEGGGPRPLSHSRNAAWTRGAPTSQRAERSTRAEQWQGEEGERAEEGERRGPIYRIRGLGNDGNAPPWA